MFDPWFHSTDIQRLGVVPTKKLRKVPKNIMQDKEELYDNALQLKQYANSITGENCRLKAKMQQLEEELGRRNKLLNGLMAQLGNVGSQQVHKMQKEVFIR
jgi:hypothetical protein